MDARVVVEQLALHLDTKDLSRFLQVSKRWNVVLWERLAQLSKCSVWYHDLTPALIKIMSFSALKESVEKASLNMYRCARIVQRGILMDCNEEMRVGMMEEYIIRCSLSPTWYMPRLHKDSVKWYFTTSEDKNSIAARFAYGTVSKVTYLAAKYMVGADMHIYARLMLKLYTTGACSRKLDKLYDALSALPKTEAMMVTNNDSVELYGLSVFDVEFLRAFNEIRQYEGDTVITTSDSELQIDSTHQFMILAMPCKLSDLIVRLQFAVIRAKSQCVRAFSSRNVRELVVYHLRRSNLTHLMQTSVAWRDVVLDMREEFVQSDYEAFIKVNPEYMIHLSEEQIDDLCSNQDYRLARYLVYLRTELSSRWEWKRLMDEYIFPEYSLNRASLYEHYVKEFPTSSKMIDFASYSRKCAYLTLDIIIKIGSIENFMRNYAGLFAKHDTPRFAELYERALASSHVVKVQLRVDGQTTVERDDVDVLTLFIAGAILRKRENFGATASSTPMLIVFNLWKIRRFTYAGSYTRVGEFFRWMFSFCKQ